MLMYLFDNFSAFYASLSSLLTNTDNDGRRRPRISYSSPVIEISHVVSPKWVRSSTSTTAFHAVLASYTVSQKKTSTFLFFKNNCVKN